VTNQPQLWNASPGPARTYQVAGRRVRVRSAVFDVFWQFAAERQAVFHRRAAGAPPPWTTDPVIASWKFTNVYRASDRTSQMLINDVIYGASACSVEDMVFRILLFKFFNTESTWRLLEQQQHPGRVSWASYEFAAYEAVLSVARRRHAPIYSPAYVIPPPPYGEQRKHSNHLRLLEDMMTSGLPQEIAAAGSLAGAYQLLRGYRSVGPFLAYQFALDLGYSPLLGDGEGAFVVAGPGALDGLAKCFEDTGGLKPEDLIRWVADTAEGHFAARGLTFTDLWGRKPSLADWQNVLCEVSKYTRATHPQMPGTTGRDRIKQRFRASAHPLQYRFPPQWGLPPSHTALPPR
jgi:alpha-glutamyl/putrescinyl thymine pyrophosphorylase clade 1